MRLPFKGLYILTQEFGNDLVINGIHIYHQYLVLHPDGTKKPMKGHNGLDFGTPHRTEIVAPHSGKVVEVAYDENGYGWYVKIESDTEGSVIAHLDSVDVKVEYLLTEGDHIGWSDNSGNSTNPHTHWGYYRMPRDRANGIAGFIDQVPYLEQAGIRVALGQLPVISGNAQRINTQEETGIDYHGLDPQNKESIQVALDTWYNVANGGYVTKSQYNQLNIQLEEVKKQLKETQQQDQTVSSDLKNYNEMRALGYNTVNDILKAIEQKDSDNLALQTEIVQIRKRNVVLATELAKSEEEDHTAATLGMEKALENKELKAALFEIAKATGVEKATTQNIISNIFNFKDLAERFIKSVERPPKKQEEPKKDVSPTTPTQYNSNWFLKLLNVKEVN